MSHSIMGNADGPTSVFVAGKVGAGQMGIGQLGFAWNWINIFGMVIVALMLIPNIVYAVKHCGGENLCESKFMNLLEQVGRYGSMIFMVLYFGSSEFGFSSVAEFLCYLSGNVILLLSYWILWGTYFYITRSRILKESKKDSGATLVFTAGRVKGRVMQRVRLLLAVVPALLFLLNSITLRYIPLLVCAVLFAIGHIYVTMENIKRRNENTGERK